MKKKNYWWQLGQLFFHFKKKSVKLPFYPIRLWIEPTNDCNYACIMCPNKDLKEKGYMEFILFQKIIDEVKSSTFDINIVHRGESLLHPQIIEMITYAKSHGLYVRMHTNGSLLTEEMAVKILRSGLDQISFSFDGYDKETYEKIRKGGNFDQTFRNIIRFLEIKKENHSKTPKTAVEVIDFGGKIGKKFRKMKTSFLRSFENLPLENLVIKEFHNWAGELGKKEPPKNFAICPFPWNALVICWDGTVVACTQDFFNKNLLGNIKKNSVKEIWNGQRMQNLRKKMAARDIGEFETCSQCDRLQRKRFLGIPKGYIWKFITKQMP